MKPLTFSFKVKTVLSSCGSCKIERGGSRWQKTRGTKIHCWFLVSPCPPAGGQGGPEKQKHLHQGKDGGGGERFTVTEKCIYWLRNTRSVVCQRLLNLFTWQLIYAAVLCSFVKINYPAEQTIVPYELICSCSLRHTCNYNYGLLLGML